MCELLGMSANVPTDLRFSFTGLMRRAGATGRHADGFGIVFHDGNGCRAFRRTISARPFPDRAPDPEPRCDRAYPPRQPRSRRSPTPTPSCASSGTILELRSQWPAPRHQAVADLPLQARRHHGQRARFLLASPRVASVEQSPAAGGRARPHDRCALPPAGRARHFQCTPQRRCPPLRLLQQSPGVAHAPRALTGAPG